MNNYGIIITATTQITDEMSDDRKEELQREHARRAANRTNIYNMFAHNHIEAEQLIDPTYTEVEAAIQRLNEKRGDHSLSYVYINCHGNEESLYCLVQDNDRNNTRGLSYNDLRTLFDTISGKKVVMIESCHAGASITRELKTDIARRMQRPQIMQKMPIKQKTQIVQRMQRINESIISAFKPRHSASQNPRLRKGELIGTDYYVITACHADEYAWGAPDGGYFTNQWCTAAGWDCQNNKAIDRIDRKMFVSLDDLCKYTSQQHHTKKDKDGNIIYESDQNDMCYPENSTFPVFGDEPIRSDMYYYGVEIVIADKSDAGTDADIEINLKGESGESGYILLDKPNADDFERNSVNHYILRISQNIGVLRGYLIRSNGKGKDPDLRIRKLQIWDVNHNISQSCGYKSEMEWLFSSKKLAHQFVLYRTVHQYNVTVKIGNRENAGTDSNIEIKLTGSKGSSIFLLLNSAADDFERNSCRTHQLSVDKDLGELKNITFRSDGSGSHSDLFVDYITVTDPASGKNYTAQCSCWFGHSHGLSKPFDLK